MTNYKLGEILIVKFPFTDGSTYKRRPALVVLDTSDDDPIIARITTQRSSTPFDTPIQSWKTANLSGPSWVRIHKLLTLDKSLIEKRIGVIANANKAGVIYIFRNLI